LAVGARVPFTVSAISLPIILAYLVTYQMSIMAEITRTTRWSGAVGPALMFGLAVGPITAGILSDMGGFDMALRCSGLLVSMSTVFLL
jgi:hypothetical protein